MSHKVISVRSGTEEKLPEPNRQRWTTAEGQDVLNTAHTSGACRQCEETVGKKLFIVSGSVRENKGVLWLSWVVHTLYI